MHEDLPDLDSHAEGAVELPARLAFSLLKAAVRIAARVEMPLNRLQELLRTAYFAELRRLHPRDMAEIARKLGVSIRTAGTLNKQLKGPFFKPENRVEPIRRVSSALIGQAATIPELVDRVDDLEEDDIRRAVTHLVELGWVTVGDDGVVRLSASMRTWLTDDMQRRVDGVNHQLGILAASVWSRFVKGNDTTAAARSWTFAGREEDVEAMIARVIDALRAEACEAEEKAIEAGDHHRFGVTVAIAPLEEER